MAEQLDFMARSGVYVLEAFVLLWIAKIAYTGIYRRVSLKHEIFERSNSAMAVATSGYIFGIVIALGGVLHGDSTGWQSDLTAIALNGVVTVVMMLVASFICEKVLLPHFNNTKEVVEDQNLGTAFVEAGVHIANGLIVLTILQGSASWEIRFALWALAQVVLVIAGLFYEWTTRHSIHAELERDNSAVGLAFGGVLIGMGNIVSISVGGDFVDWLPGLQDFAANVAFGFVALFVIKRLTDVLLAPGVKLADEQTGENPKVGAGLLEAVGYIGGSMLIVWVF